MVGRSKLNGELSSKYYYSFKEIFQNHIIWKFKYFGAKLSKKHYTEFAISWNNSESVTDGGEVRNYFTKSSIITVQEDYWKKKTYYIRHLWHLKHLFRFNTKNKIFSFFYPFYQKYSFTFTLPKIYFTLLYLL